MKMNDRYLFRGKSKYNNEWIYGALVRLGKESFSDPDRYGITDKGIPIVNMNVCYNFQIDEVIPETVGQCTGLQDKNGEPIFEGDIVDVMHDPHYIGIAIQRIGVFKVMFHEGCFMKRNEKGFFHFIPSDECKIVGNVFDNPDLTEVEK